MQSYDYANRTGVRPLSWEQFAALTARIAEELAALKIDMIIGVARAGLFPATAVALHLRRELYPVRLTRRVNDEVQFKTPVWRVPVPSAVAGLRVAVVDEIADTGESLELVRQKVLAKGASEAVSACLVRHSWANPVPMVCPLVSDELIIFPWDRQVLIDGVWQPHLEIVGALAAQRQPNPTD